MGGGREKIGDGPRMRAFVGGSQKRYIQGGGEETVGEICEQGG